ncbi:MAG: LysM peptidoglycan-binding domain-containing protein [Verrucomicrobia bacterium]|nr:LysM peptidoglycan-binding domain-containing protein [Verrucomicrobiota bacterium]
MDLRSIRSVGRAAFVAACAALLVAGPGCAKRNGAKSTTIMGDAEEALAAGNIGRAVSCLEKEIELNPRNPAPYLRLALVYEHIYKDPKKADAQYGRYLGIETSEAKREMVERWRRDLGTAAGAGDLPMLPEDGVAGDTSLARQLDEARRKLRETEKARDGFAQKLIALESVQDQLKQSQATVSRIKAELGTLKAGIEARDTSLAELQEAYDSLKAQGDTAQSTSTGEIARLERQIADLDAQNKTLSARNAELEDEQSRAGRRTLNDKLDEARTALKAAEKQNEQYARRIRELEARVVQLESGSSAATTITGDARAHVVREGETLRTISLKYFGTKDRWREIYDANRDVLPDPDHVRVGQKLIIPASGSR